MPVDKVLLAAPRGFCAGVEMAIKALAWMVRAFEPPVYCYHEIVHNRLVVDRFRDLGVVFVDDIAEVPEGRPIMLSAHGSAPEVVGGRQGPRQLRGERGVPPRDQGPPRGQDPRRQGLPHRLRRPRGPRGGRRHDGRRSRRHRPGRVGGRGRRAARRLRRAAGRPAGPDDAVAPRLVGDRRTRRRALPRAVAARPQRPVLRHHQPAVGAGRDRAPLRRRRRHRVGQLVQHPGSRAARPRVGQRPGLPRQRAPTSCPTTSAGSSASPPAPRLPRS